MPEQEIIPHGAPMGREDILSHIYGEVAGGRALSRVLREDDGMPSSSEFWRWHMADEAIRDNLARARQNGVEAHLEEALEIADTPCEGEIVTMKDGKTETRREDMLGHRKLQVETRIRRAQMIAPRKYGPKMDLTTDGEPITTADPTSVAARAAAIMAAARDRKGDKS